MKPTLDKFAVVTATTNEDRSRACIDSWAARGVYHWPTYTRVNGSVGPYLGVVPAFAQGVERALAAGATLIACFHDDLEILEDGWDQKVWRWFESKGCGLAGFGGGVGLGDSNIYQTAYSPHQLARQGFVSNMRDAEAHGIRSVVPQRVACLDGFSQIGTRAFWQGRINGAHQLPLGASNLFQRLADLGVTHHMYDGALGCYARRLGWDAWMLPIACHHFGGRTAVGDQGYHAWAESVVPGGDRTFWELAHSICYTEFRDVLPIRVKA